jgi:hypothetical protein
MRSMVEGAAARSMPINVSTAVLLFLPRVRTVQSHTKSPPPCGEVEMLKRLWPRGISGGGTVAAAFPHPKLLAKSRDQFRPPHKGEAVWGANAREYPILQIGKSAAIRVA